MAAREEAEQRRLLCRHDKGAICWCYLAGKPRADKTQFSLSWRSDDEEVTER